MPQQAFKPKFSPFKNILLFTVKRNIGLTVLITVFALLFCPVYMLVNINTLGYTTKEPFDFSGAAPGLICFISVLTTLVACIYFFINFSYLYSKNSSDMFHSMPVSRGRLLFSRYLASILPILIPVILVYASMCGICCLNNVEGNLAVVLYGIICNILFLLACSAFTLIFIVCAGSVFDLIISFFVYNIGILLTVASILQFCQSLLTGFAYSSGINSSVFMHSATPFVSGAIKMFSFTSRLTDRIGKPCVEFIFFSVRMLLLTAVSLTACYFLYKKRKSERSGDTYAYRFIYIVCMFIAGFLGGFAFGMLFSQGEYNTLFYIFASVGAVLSAVTFGAINDRGFKRIKRSAAAGAVSAAALLLTAVIMFTGCFGFTDRIPPSDSIKCVEVEFPHCNVTLTNPEKALELHTKIINNKDLLNEGYLEYGYVSSYGEYRTYGVTFNYVLKNGFSMKRRFEASLEDFSDEFISIYTSDENIASVKNELDRFSQKNIRITKYDNETGEEVFDAEVTREEYQKLFELYLAAMKNAGSDSVTGKNLTEYSVYSIAENFEDYDTDYLSYTLSVESNFKALNDYIASLNLEERAQTEE